jgi:hypothetical protein
MRTIKTYSKRAPFYNAFMRIYPDCSSAIRLDEPFELLAPLISQVVITTVTSGAVVQSQSVC